jgi:hypothetical protein
MQHKVNGWEDPKRVDDSIKKCACKLRKKLLKDGLISNDILSRRGKGTLTRFTAFFKKKER